MSNNPTDGMVLGINNGAKYNEVGGWWIPDPEKPEEIARLLRLMECRSNQWTPGFRADDWREALASGDENQITLFYPSNWMTEEEVEAPGVLDAVLEVLKGLHYCDDPKPVTCLTCGLVWCDRCDPAPSALCHRCHGRGYSSAEIRGEAS